MKKKRRDEPNPGRRIFKRERMLLKLGTGNGERGTGKRSLGRSVQGNPHKNSKWRTKEKKMNKQ